MKIWRASFNDQTVVDVHADNIPDALTKSRDSVAKLWDETKKAAKAASEKFADSKEYYQSIKDVKAPGVDDILRVELITETAN